MHTCGYHPHGRSTTFPIVYLPIVLYRRPIGRVSLPNYLSIGRIVCPILFLGDGGLFPHFRVFLPSAIVLYGIAAIFFGLLSYFNGLDGVLLP